MKIWISKYALSGGITEHECEPPKDGGSNAGLGPLPEPVAWANDANLTSARLGRERYGSRGACELHTWREGGPTDYHAAALYTESQMLESVAAERERCANLAESWPVYANDRPSAIGVRIAAAIRRPNAELTGPL